MEQWQYPYSITITVTFRDLDVRGHVNNAVYFTYLEQARIAYALYLTGGTTVDDIKFIAAEATVIYLRPAHFGDRLEVGVRVSEIGTKSFVMEYGIRNQASGEMIARGRTVQVWYDYQAGRSLPVPDDFRHSVERENARLKA